MDNCNREEFLKNVSEKFIKGVENSEEWGGEFELTGLALAYGYRIILDDESISGVRKRKKFGPKGAKRLHLKHRFFHFHPAREQNKPGITQITCTRLSSWKLRKEGKNIKRDYDKRPLKS